jgi:hypothetical protein
MADSASIPARQPDPAATGRLAEDVELIAGIEDDHPNWVAWRGVNGWLYARRLKTSPPLVIHAGTPGLLRLRIVTEEARRAL